MADFKQKLTAAAALTIGLASLASDTNLLAGREGTAIDNQTDLFVDVVLGGKITTGTSPTAAKSIYVLAYGSWDGTLYTGGAAGADGGLTLTAETRRLLVPVALIPTHAISNTPYAFGPVSLKQIFGELPRKWGIFVVHNTGVALHATGGNHEIKYTGVHYQSV